MSVTTGCPFCLAAGGFCRTCATDLSRQQLVDLADRLRLVDLDRRMLRLLDRLARDVRCEIGVVVAPPVVR